MVRDLVGLMFGCRVSFTMIRARLGGLEFSSRAY